MKAPSFRSALDVAASIAVIGAATLLAWSLLKPKVSGKPEGPHLEGKTISYEGAQLKGAPSAPAALVIYSDFECPFCGRFARDTLPKLIKLYVDTGKLLVAFRNLPLPIHDSAALAANAAWCAGQDGKFWEMHDALFKNQRTLSVESINEMSRGLGFGKPWEACLKGLSDQAESVIDREASGAKALGISSTPTILIGRNVSDHSVAVNLVVSGARPLQDFVKGVDESIAPVK